MQGLRDAMLIIRRMLRENAGEDTAGNQRQVLEIALQARDEAIDFMTGTHSFRELEITPEQDDFVKVHNIDEVCKYLLKRDLSDKSVLEIAKTAWNWFAKAPNETFDKECQQRVFREWSDEIEHSPTGKKFKQFSAPVVKGILSNLANYTNCFEKNQKWQIADTTGLSRDKHNNIRINMGWFKNLLG